MSLLASLIVSTLAAAALLDTGSGGARAFADNLGDEIVAPPPMYKANGVTVNEQLGARVPVDAKFRTQDGKVVTLGDVLSGELPTILTFNYADCPMLCSLQLNGLTAALPLVPFQIGGQFRIVTISLEPAEQLARLSKMRDRYIERVLGETAGDARRAALRKGWTFLAAETPGDAAAIRRVAESVGFAYVFVKERAEWAHPAALIFLSTKGVVTRYVYGIEFAPEMLRESIFKAGLAEPSTAVGFMNRCYHYDPDANNHARAGMTALRIGAAGFLVLFVAGLGFLYLRRQASGREVASGKARS